MPASVFDSNQSGKAFTIDFPSSSIIRLGGFTILSHEQDIDHAAAACLFGSSDNPQPVACVYDVIQGVIECRLPDVDHVGINENGVVTIRGVVGTKTGVLLV